ncbi:MAG: hypothetical protein JXB29_00885 [Sedimentisphaerales bacterium]|nr:hypothetical protein [Sedimentisphaerales bacterium]
MTGRDKIKAAFSKDGTREIPVVIPYEGIFIRDHWEQLTDYPWWYRQEPNLEKQILWHRDAINKIGQDWLSLRDFYSTKDQGNLNIQTTANDDKVLLVDKSTVRQQKLSKPKVGGWSAGGHLESVKPEHIPKTTDEIDELISDVSRFDKEKFLESGKCDLASALLAEFGGQLYPLCQISSPLWSCYGLWGFEGMMTMIASRADLVKYACRRYLALGTNQVHKAAALGAQGIWIEECLTDMISPDAFASLNVPFVRKLVEEIRTLGLESIYYYCGNPAGKWEHILSIGADAISLEESKKGFEIDIEDVAAKVQGQCAVLGNLDAIGVLQDGSEEQLREEIARQIAAGRRNSSRFIMSLGSPITPETTVERVRLYCDMACQIASAR